MRRVFFNQVHADTDAVEALVRLGVGITVRAVGTVRALCANAELQENAKMSTHKYNPARDLPLFFLVLLFV